MSSPGGPGNWGHYDRGPEQYYDPMTGQPVHPSSGGYGANTGHQPFSGGSQYQGFGYFEQGQQQFAGTDAPPRSSGRKPVILTMAIAAVVVAGIVATVALTAGGGSPQAGPVDPSGSAPTSDPTAVRSSDTSTSPTNPSSGSSNDEDVIKPVPPVVPGWQGMGVVEIGVAYDVPQGWVAKPGTVSGFENDSGQRVAMTNFSGYREDFCAASDVSYRARVGTIGSEHADPVVAAKTAIRKWARLGWATKSGRQPQIAMNPVRTVTLRGGNNTEAKLVSATITPPEPGPCGTPRMYLSVLALSTDGNAALMLGMADQGVPGAVPPGDIDKALTTLRPLPK